MHSRAIKLLVLFTLLLVTTVALFMAFEIFQFWKKGTSEPVIAEKLVSSKNLTGDQGTTVTARQSSTQTEQTFFEPSAPTVHDRFDVKGSVRDRFGNPLHRAIVELSSNTADVQITTETRVSGVFVVKQLQPANDYHVQVKSLPRYLSFDAYNVALTSRMDNWTITLDYVSQASLQGAIVDQLGSPVPALGLLAVSEEWSGNTARILSDQTGQFNLVNFIPGRIILRSESLPSIIIHGLSLSPDEVTLCELVVDIGSEQLSGTVRRDDGIPIPDVNIRMRFVQLHQDGYRSTTIRSVTSNRSGEFHFSGLGSGPRTVLFSADGFRRLEFDMDPSLNTAPYSITLYSSALPSSR